jgi:hypothetical protein
MDPKRLVQRPVERGDVAAKFLPQCLLVLGFAEVGRRRVDALLFLLRTHRGAA